MAHLSTYQFNGPPLGVDCIVAKLHPRLRSLPLDRFLATTVERAERLTIGYQSKFTDA